MISFQHQGDNGCGNIWSSSLSFINFAAKSSWHFKMRRSCFFILLKRICMCVLTYSMSFYSSFHILPLSIFIYSPLCICSRSAWHNSGSYLVLYSPPFLLKPHCGSSVCPVSSPFAEICFNFFYIWNVFRFEDYVRGGGHGGWHGGRLGEVKIVKEVKRSDGSWHFVCGESANGDAFC